METKSKALVLSEKQHPLHAYTHRNMAGEMAIRLQGNYTYIYAGQVCVYMSLDQARALVNELDVAIEREATPNVNETLEYAFGTPAEVQA